MKPNVKSAVKLDIKISIELTLHEARALNEIVGYNVDDFLKVFYQHVGQSYLKPHESGVRQLFKTAKELLPKEIHKADKIVEGLNNILKTTTDES